MLHPVETSKVCKLRERFQAYKLATLAKLNNFASQNYSLFARGQYIGGPKITANREPSFG